MNLADLFTTAALTASINKLPYKPTKISALGLFDDVPLQSTVVTIDERQGRLSLVPNISRNGDPIPHKRFGRVRRTFQTTHLPEQAVLRPEELQNITPFGEGESLEVVQARIINDRLQALKDNLETTREWQRLGALRGKIYDADGTTLIYDLFAEYGISKATANIAFSSASTDVRAAIMAGKRAAELKLGGVMVEGWVCFCSPSFFDSFVGHAKVQAAFQNYQEARDRIGGDMRSGFVFGGVTFIEYNASISGQSFLPTGYAQMVPVAKGLFKMFNAPANYNETVNTLGLPMYAKSEPRSLGKGWLLEAQANPLAVCTYPEVLQEFIAT